MVAPSNVYPARLASSGPRIGNPPEQVGNSALAGREWGKNGSGATANVPGTALGDVAGLESVVVDMKPSTSGYRYDIFGTVNTFGAGGETEGDGFVLAAYGSTDGGSTWSVLKATGAYEAVGQCALLDGTRIAGDATYTINRVKLTLQRAINASANLQYAPPDACIVVR